MWLKRLSNLFLFLLIIVLVVIGITYYRAWKASTYRPKFLSKVIKTIVLPVAAVDIKGSLPETERMEVYIQTHKIQCEPSFTEACLCIPLGENKSEIQLYEQCSQETCWATLEGECTSKGFKPRPLAIRVPFQLLEALAQEVEKNKVKVVYELIEDQETSKKRFRMTEIKIEDKPYFKYFKQNQYFEKLEAESTFYKSGE